MSLLIRKGSDEPWHVPEVNTYLNEASLQEIIAGSPSLLPGVPEVGVLAVAEVGVAGPGRIDVLCLDLDGGLTICECKLGRNPQIKREIVGQLMAYAAALWRMPFDEFEQRVVACTKDEVGLVGGMERLATESGVSDWSRETFRSVVTDNLAKGRFRLVFAVDEITDELKRIVEFLNAHTSSELQVLAVAIGYVEDAGVHILTPTMYGSDLADSKDPRRKTWDRASFLAELAARAPEAAPSVKVIMDWADESRSAEVYGTGRVEGSWYPVWMGTKRRDAPISLWTGGSVYVNLAYFRRRDPLFDETSFRSGLSNQMEGLDVSLGPDDGWAAAFDGLQSLDQHGRERLIHVLNWVKKRFYVTPNESVSENTERGHLL
ncbi:hypothetical protein BH20ACT1_BH20ACT1_03580 [soil metagenome]